MQRYFMLKAISEVDEQAIAIDGEIFHHMSRVMRMKVEQQAYLVFDEEVVVKAEVTEILDDHLLMKVVEHIHQSTELPVDVTLFCGLPKGDKLELITQKSTELGAHHIVGFPSKTSIVKWNDKKRLQKQERLEKIAREAAEQSHRSISPDVLLLADINEMYNMLAHYDHVLVAFEEAAKEGEHAQLVQTFKEIQPGEKIAFIFGPEGGITPKEITQFESRGAKVCALGPRILRTETAPFYALSALSYHLELQGQ
ncbi:16S rRNA (uracil(1498)-N(3))-methyltransferase [Vagococcus xieshaowenii]|uniref:Ribosomal RNA small subunit methyltransferase E n=1 Tax=Vagococcus xieshaowenii TaxID=2562451 RepID=A0AAJ5JLZ0_9ENTE|nr:16S rRNA (uracil(1498)-N(3))-methyltransferase [Vagococcus xieshaowenii]QCA29217.1 16S rRNA (uracil(1498)-N(3))-methyltransferase [Vagococcus xieshaowenii]TFZ43270.1 16S rRNA (uracil(1498)-N(3))-methyltransferase [Vagococcus xieshaowenii]